MSEADSILQAVKSLLKKQKRTYRDLGKALNLSEPTIKRMFSEGQVSLDRLEQIGKVIGYTVAEIAQEAESIKARIRTLTQEQEASLVADDRLLLVTVCVLNHWSLADIIATYDMTDAECVQKLLQLDRLHLIDLLPGNRIRLVVARDFDWIPNGPIMRFFRVQGRDDFLAGQFHGNGDEIAFVTAMLTDAAIAQLQKEILRLRERFTELHGECQRAPIEARHGTCMLIATRKKWAPEVFMRLRRK